MMAKILLSSLCKQPEFFFQTALQCGAQGLKVYSKFYMIYNVVGFVIERMSGKNNGIFR